MSLRVGLPVVLLLALFLVVACDDDDQGSADATVEPGETSEATSTPAEARGDDWLMFSGTLERLGYNANETVITKETVASLVLKWRFATGAPVVASPAVATIAVAGEGDVRTVVDQVGAAPGAADFRLARSQTGQLALIWQEASEQRVDLWSALHDPTLKTWSRPVQLTADGAMEHAVAPTFDNAGSLVAVYNKVEATIETRTLTVGDDQVVVDSVPVPARSARANRAVVCLAVERHQFWNERRTSSSSSANSSSVPRSAASWTWSRTKPSM